MFSTGPMFVSIQMAVHGNKKEIEILSPELYGKYKGSSMALIKHLKGSSWHGNDAKFFLLMDKHGSRSMATIFYVSILLLVVALAIRRSGMWDIDARLIKTKANDQVKEI